MMVKAAANLELVAVAAAALIATAHATMLTRLAEAEAWSALAAKQERVQRRSVASCTAIDSVGGTPLWRAANRLMSECLRAIAGWFDLRARMTMGTASMRMMLMAARKSTRMAPMMTGTRMQQENRTSWVNTTLRERMVRGPRCDRMRMRRVADQRLADRPKMRRATH